MKTIELSRGYSCSGLGSLHDLFNSDYKVAFNDAFAYVQFVMFNARDIESQIAMGLLLKFVEIGFYHNEIITLLQENFKVPYDDKPQFYLMIMPLLIKLLEKGYGCEFATQVCTFLDTDAYNKVPAFLDLVQALKKYASQ